MAYTAEQLQKLPPSVAALLQREATTQPAPPVDSGVRVQGDLGNALGRRFGQQYGADFDPIYDAGIRGLLSDVPGHQARFQQTRRRMGEDFERTAQDLDKQNTRAVDQNTIGMADRGILRSGANLVANERLGESFLKSVQGANMARERGLSDVASEESGIYNKIRQRQSQLEAEGTERARVREETRRWQEEQVRMEQERLAREEQMRREEQQRADAAMLAAQQPMPMSGGGYSGGGGGGGGGGGDGGGGSGGPNSNVSVDTYEFNLRDPNEVRALQRYLGLPQDGRFGSTTEDALRRKNAVMFDDRPIDKRSRLGTGGSMWKVRGGLGY